MNDEVNEYQRYIYKFPPIQEAIFEARFIDKNYNSTLNGRFYDKISKNYPTIQDLNQNSLINAFKPPLGDNVLFSPVPEIFSNVVFRILSTRFFFFRDLGSEFDLAIFFTFLNMTGDVEAKPPNSEKLALQERHSVSL